MSICIGSVSSRDSAKTASSSTASGPPPSAASYCSWRPDPHRAPSFGSTTSSSSTNTKPVAAMTMTREELEVALRRVVLREDEMLAEAGVVLEEITAADEGEMK
jgi:hypothetical protein